jgi:outer membrane protein assembly factor BamB
LDAFTGVENRRFVLPDGLTPSDISAGLAGWTDELFYINGDVNQAQVYVLNPNDGSTVRTFNISGGWFVEGLGYWSNDSNSYLYTCGCVVEDMHRYQATDGSGPTFFWSTIFDAKSVAGDNGGRIFAFAKENSASTVFEIFEIDPLVNRPPIGRIPSPSQDIVGLAFDGKYVYAGDSNKNLYSIDPDNGSIINSVKLNYTPYALASTEGVPMPMPQVPGPIPLFGVAAAFGYSRKLRKRIKTSKLPEVMSAIG